MARALAIGVCGAMFCVWNRLVTGHFSLGAVVFFAALVWVAYRWGSRLAAVSRLALGLPFVLLVGMLGVNTALFALRCVFAFPMPAYLAVIGLLALVDWFLPRPAGSGERSDSVESSARGQIAEVLAVVVSLLGATAWSRDALNPVVCRDQVCHFRVWDDAFIHARLVAQIAAPEVPLQNRRIAGQSAPMYHYASYVLPAVLTGVSPTSPYHAYLGFLVPLGVLLTGLAAFSLGAYWGGPWAGLAACLALLLPDPAFQGTGNFFLSYHWLTQVSHGLSFGIAVSVLAWLMMFEACRTGRWWLLLLSYAILALCLAYKAHVAVANVLPLALYPALLMRGVPWRWRTGWGVLVVGALLGATHFSRPNERLPQIAFGNAFRAEHLQRVVTCTENASLQEAFPSFAEHIPAWLELVKGSLVLSVCTFGLWGVAAAVLLPCALWRGSPGLAVFPMLVVMNYLLMALGLGANESPVGGADEFVHRPFVWAYFVLATWTAAYAAASVARGSSATAYLARDSRRTVGVWLLCGVSLAVPLAAFVLADGLQRRPKFAYAGVDLELPLGLVTCCEYVRVNSHPADIVQDSQGNQHFAVSGLCARQIYISCDDLLRARNQNYLDRLAGFNAWKEASAEAQIQEYARQERIRYCIAHPGDLPTWPSAVVDSPVFSCGGFRVYRFSW